MTSMNTRRDFLKWAAAAGIGTSADVLELDSSSSPFVQAPDQRTESDIGSLFQFVQEHAVKGKFPSSFLSEKSDDPIKWRQKNRTRFLEMLHYAPPKCP